jgi:hypothetical protein
MQMRSVRIGGGANCPYGGYKKQLSFTHAVSVPHLQSEDVSPKSSHGQVCSEGDCVCIQKR